MMMRPVQACDVVVIGGGISGCATTWELVRCGYAVKLLERGELNRESSGTNAGNLHIQRLSHLARAPESAAERAALNAAAALHLAARDRWAVLEEELGSDLGVASVGGLMIGEGEAHRRLLEEKVELERSLGLDVELLDGSGARRLCPGLAEEVTAAEYCPGEGFADPLRVAPALAERAVGAGADLLLNTAVVGIEVERDGRFLVHASDGQVLRSRLVVDAAGSWAGAVAKMVGLSLPVHGDILQVHVTEPWPESLVPMLQHIGRRLTLKQSQNGKFMIGGGWPGGWPDGGLSRVPRLETIAGNVGLAAHVFPVLKDVRILRSWCGVIPAVDRQPLILDEYRRVPGFYVLVTGETGFTLGPLVGSLMAELVQRGSTSMEIEHFGLEQVVSGATAP